MHIPKAIKLLVINPNSSAAVTESLRPLLSKSTLKNTQIDYWTCPTGPAILKTEADLSESALHCRQPLLAIESEYDGFLIACYADHPLIAILRTYLGHKPVVGIFEASVTTALQLVSPGMKFGIITTGCGYETMLTEGVWKLLGATEGRNLPMFGSVVATGISLDVLKDESSTQVKSRVVETTKKILKAGNIDVICVGGVILAGIEAYVREACVEALGPKGKHIKLVDQMLAGITTLHHLIHTNA